MRIIHYETELQFLSVHYETALQFLQDLDSGRLGAGLSLTDRAGALAVVIAGAVAGASAAAPAIDIAKIRRHAESIRDVCESAYDDESPICKSREAARWSHGGALAILRLLDGEPVDTSSEGEPCAESADTAGAARSAEQGTATRGAGSAASPAASSTSSRAETADDERRSDAVRRLHEAMRGYPPVHRVGEDGG